MRETNRGIIWLLINVICYSAASLGFVKTGFNSSLISFWVGLNGVLLSVTLLSLDTEFSVHSLLHKRQLYLSFLNGLIFGGGANGLHFISLRYILPSDSMLINAFFCLCSSVVAETVRERKCPTLLSVASVLSGVIGTGLICNPQALFSLDILQMKSLLGVSMATLSGVAFVFLLTNIRSFNEINPSWNYLGFIFGTGAFGLMNYRPFRTINPDCSLMAKILVYLCFMSQAVASFAVIKGSTKVTIIATFVIQTSTSIVTFAAQLFLFPDRITLQNTVGTIFIVCSVALQLVVLRVRDRKLQREHMLRAIEMVNE